MISQQISYGPSDESPNGKVPHKNSYKHTPNDHKSTKLVYPLPNTISGAMQWGVPIIVKVRAILLVMSAREILDVDKLISLTQPFQSTKKFQGLMSRQMIQTFQKYQRIKMMLAVQNWASEVDNSPNFLSTWQNYSPLTYQVKYTKWCLDCIFLPHLTTKGNDTVVMTSHSSIMNSHTSAYSSSCFDNVLATYSCPCLSLTKNKSPNCPLDSLSTTSNPFNSTPYNCLMSWLSYSVTFFFLPYQMFLITSQKHLTFPKDSQKAVSEIYAMTPLVCMMISSSKILDLFSLITNSQPQHWHFPATIVPVLSFFSPPSITTTNFWNPATPFLKIGSLILNDEIFIDSMTLSICSLLSWLMIGFFSNAHRIKFLNVTQYTLSPMILFSVSLPSTRHVTYSSALTVSCRIVLQQSDCSPKESPLLSLRKNLLPLQTEAVPSLIQYIADPGSPSCTMVWFLQNLWVIRAEAIMSFWSLVRFMKNLIPQRFLRFSVYYFTITYSTASRKVFLSMTHSSQSYFTLTVYLRFVWYNSAISPKPSPCLRAFLNFQFSRIQSLPFWTMKKDDPVVSSSQITPASCSLQLSLTDAKYIFSLTFSSSASLRLQKMKWFLSELRIKFESVLFFSLIVTFTFQVILLWISRRCQVQNSSLLQAKWCAEILRVQVRLRLGSQDQSCICLFCDSIFLNGF